MAESLPSSLLPKNATDYERAMEQVSFRLTDLTVKIADFWNPETLPEQLIPWLGWEWSLDVWSPDWSEQTKRQMLADSMAYHQLKGTKKSVQDAVMALGSNIQITEWFNASPPEPPYTFDALVDSMAGSATGVLQQQLIKAIDRAKPVRCHYTVSIAARGRIDLTTMVHSTVANYCRLTLSSQ